MGSLVVIGQQYQTIMYDRPRTWALKTHLLYIVVDWRLTLAILISRAHTHTQTLSLSLSLSLCMYIYIYISCKIHISPHHGWYHIFTWFWLPLCLPSLLVATTPMAAWPLFGFSKPRCLSSSVALIACGGFLEWGYPKMDVLFHGKSQSKMDDLGVAQF